MRLNCVVRDAESSKRAAPPPLAQPSHGVRTSLPTTYCSLHAIPQRLFLHVLHPTTALPPWGGARVHGSQPNAAVYTADSWSLGRPPQYLYKGTTGLLQLPVGVLVRKCMESLHGSCIAQGDTGNGSTWAHTAPPPLRLPAVPPR